MINIYTVYIQVGYILKANFHCNVQPLVVSIVGNLWLVSRVSLCDETSLSRVTETNMCEFVRAVARLLGFTCVCVPTGETDEEDLDDLLQEVTSRSKFEESWLWRDFKLNRYTKRKWLSCILK